MCGFVSIHASGKPLESRMQSLDRMLETLAHRGPDGKGVHHVSGSLLQGHHRLAIIDPEHGQQPMVTPDGRWSLVFNGAIYNYVELRSELEARGVDFRTTSDTEVLLYLLVADGAAAIPRLNGMFAFVLHDRETNRWLAARDPFGIKPLYMVRPGDELVFASEIKALLAHPDVTARIDEASLAHYVSFQFCLGERTMFGGIDKLEPASWMAGEGSHIDEIRRYWTPATDVLSGTDDDAVERVRALIDDSVRLQLRSDVLLGGYLSGGLDSSVVCSLATHHLGSGIQVFHGRYDEGPAYDESPHARVLADWVGAEYHDVTPTPADFVEHMPRIIRLLDEPVAGPGAFGQFMVSRLAGQHVKVVLGGQGGDETFGGYARYLVAYLEQALKGAILGTQEEGSHIVTLDNVIPQLPALIDYFPLMREFWSEGLFGPMDRRYFSLVNRSRGVTELLHPDLRAAMDTESVFEEYRLVFNRPDTPSYINKMLSFDMSTLLPALLQVEDRMSMGASLESRVPLLDTRVVDFLGSVSPAMKFREGTGKHLLKQAARDLIPPEILGRRDKIGFSVPLVEWMSHPEVADFVRSSVLDGGGVQIFDRVAVEKMLDSCRFSNRQLWGVLSLQLWNRTYLGG